jgi:CBS domain-containing protein
MRVLGVVDDSDPAFMRIRKVVRAVAENMMDIIFILLVHKEGPDTPDLIKKLKAVSREEGVETQVEVIETAGLINPAFPIGKKARATEAVAVFVLEEMRDIILGLEEQFRGSIAIEPISGAYPVREIMTSPPITVSPEFTTQEAAAVMKQRGITSLVVMREGNPVGMLTLSDLMKVVQRGQSSREVRVAEVMSAPLNTIDIDEPAEGAAKVMAERAVRILGVLDEGNLTGVITTTDLFKLPPKKKEKMDKYLLKIIRLC